MAILIPSSRIYNKQKSIINNNIIERIEIKEKTSSPVIETDVSVYSFSGNTTDLSSPVAKTIPSYDSNGEILGGNLSTAVSVYFVSDLDTDDRWLAFASAYFVRNIEVSNFTVTIPRLSKNLYITSLSEGENSFSVYVKGKKRTAPIQSTVENFWSEENPSKSNNGNITEIEIGDYSAYEITNLYFPEEEKVSETATTIFGTSTEVVVSSKYEDGNYFVFEVLSETEDNYVIQISGIPLVLNDYRMTGKTGTYSYYPEGGGSIDNITPISISGTLTSFEAEKIEININGDRYGFELKDTTSVFGSGNFSYTIDGSEIFQTSNTYNGTPLNGVIAENIMSSYENGKETATIRCSIADYFDENGENVISISTERMTFENGDIVVPMVMGRNGVDKPMSLNKDGTAKQFRVVGINIFFNGAVWQEISLQEI